MEKSERQIPEYRFVRTDKLYALVSGEAQRLTQKDIFELLDSRDEIEFAQFDDHSNQRRQINKESYFQIDCIELFDYIIEQKSLKEAEARYIFSELLKVASKLHARGKFLGSLQPECVILYDSCKVKVLKETGHGFPGSLPQGPSIVEAYCPPEWFSNPGPEAVQTEACDIFALGNLLGIMMLGTMLFDQPSLKNRFYKRFAQNSGAFLDNLFKSRAAHVPLDPDLKSLLMQMLHPEPASRPSLEEVASNRWVQSGSTQVFSFSCLAPAQDSGSRKSKKDPSIREGYEPPASTKEERLPYIRLSPKPVSTEPQPPQFSRSDSFLQMNYAYFSAAPSQICSVLPRISEKLGGTLVEGKEPYSFIYEIHNQDQFKMLMKVFKSENCSVAQFHILDGSMFAFRDAVDQIKHEIIEMYMDK